MAPVAGSTASTPAGAETKSSPVRPSKAETSAPSAALPLSALCSMVKRGAAFVRLPDISVSGGVVPEAA